MAAIFAFEREYQVNEIVVWLFVLREICLYAGRVVVGSFERKLPSFRKLALVHAGIIRAGIVFGCIFPLFGMPWTNQIQISDFLSAIFLTSAILGFLNLWLVFKE
jgi:hypothetical protein